MIIVSYLIGERKIFFRRETKEEYGGRSEGLSEVHTERNWKGCIELPISLPLTADNASLLRPFNPLTFFSPVSCNASIFCSFCVE